MFSHFFPGNAPVHWPKYGYDSSNLVFNATDAEVNIHTEPDDYRSASLQIWIDNVPDADYFGEQPN